MTTARWIVTLVALAATTWTVRHFFLRRAGANLALAATAFTAGGALGYLWGTASSGTAGTAATLLDALRLPVEIGELGPRLVEAGAIDVDRMSAHLASVGTPMTEAQRRLLVGGEEIPLDIDGENAAFLLDLFWALGLTNRSPVLTEGPMMRLGPEQVLRFASTGGWSLGARPVRELYASLPLVPLDPAQSRGLEKVAREVYRPCCDNPTWFPDCNHGMAMLGMLTLMAAAGVDQATMFEAAAAANAVWFPGQYRQLARWFEATEGKEIREADPRRLVARQVASGSGFRAVRRALARAGLETPTANGGVGAC